MNTLAFFFLDLHLHICTLAFDMAASPLDFVFYHDADDDYPIGQGPPDSSTASTPVDPITPTSSAGPSNHVRQLRGHPKVTINTAVIGKPPAKVATKARHQSGQKRSHPDNDMPPPQDLRAKKAQAPAISINSEPEMGDGSDGQGSGSDDDDGKGDEGDLTSKDKSVSYSPIIDTSTIY
jgi:hypothetical protein